MTPLGGFFEFAPSFLWTSPHVPFSFADFALYPITSKSQPWDKLCAAMTHENESCEFQQITEPEDRLGDTKTLRKKNLT